MEDVLGVEVEITYKAFEKYLKDNPGAGDVVSVTVDWVEGKHLHYKEILEQVFIQTNTYSGSFWDRLKNKLPSNRTHTALSVGDEVKIFGWLKFVCDFSGWREVIEPDPCDCTSCQYDAIPS